MNQMQKPAKGEKIDKEIAAKMWAEDASMGEIAEYFGTSRNTVSGMMNRNRDLFPKKRAELVAEAQGRKNRPSVKRNRRVNVQNIAKARQIAAGVERDTKVKPNRNTGLFGPRKRKNIHQIRIEDARREVEEFEAGTSPLLQTLPDDAARIATGKELMALGLHECKWPLNEGNPYIFCAKATGGPRYCPHHSARSYRPWRGDW